MEIKNRYLTGIEKIVEIYKDVVENMLADNIVRRDESYPNKNTVRKT
ncbi:MAG: hypothetical protein LBB61_01810 [Treponema sp.]|jgi:hypothetical protein|nr:hypothetical protein [Treponema sp.]